MQIILSQPRIPQNAGAVARLAAATRTKLVLARPLGFRVSDASVKRAGLDYWEAADVSVSPSLEQAVADSTGEVYYFSRFAEHSYLEPDYTTDDTLVFGSETEGLPDEVMRSVAPNHLLRIPIFNPAVRSLNLATSVAIVLYEALRQIENLQ